MGVGREGRANYRTEGFGRQGSWNGNVYRMEAVGYWLKATV